LLADALWQNERDNLEKMEYKRFHIEKYKALINSDITIMSKPVPIIGVNESGKSSALEALAHFDYRNDDLVSSRGWKFFNRYKPEEKEFCVSADIELSQSELDQIIAGYIPPEPTPEAVPEPAPEGQEIIAPTAVIVEDAANNPETPEVSAEPIKENFDDVRSLLASSTTIKIERHFNSQNETKIYHINGISRDEIQPIIRDIIGKLPRLYYFDNFLDSPLPDSIVFSEEYASGKSDVLDEYQRMVEGAFSSMGISLRDFMNTEDEDTRDTLLSRVNDNVTQKIIEDWTKMHVREGEIDVNKLSNIKIAFKLDKAKRSIDIKIKEWFLGEDEKACSDITMGLSERSQGFRWFFNFSARKCFAAVHEEKFIYLFDEPGSYLHNSAQTVLLDAIIDLAKDHPVIYTTHCEFLLDPMKININDIRVVQKENYSIELIPLSNAKTRKHEGALSTLNNALKMRTPLETTINKKVVVTEGITDFYFWKPIIDCVFLPGSGAGNNRYLISIAIGSAKQYVALFDGDGAGDRAITHYKGCFGEEESRNWISYLNSDNTPVVLEELLSDADKARLKKISGQDDIKQAITISFFGKKCNEEFWKGIDSTTKANVQKNVGIISSHIGLSNSNLRFGFTAK
jgi:AAA15 family ATPase/GTPase